MEKRLEKFIILTIQELTDEIDACCGLNNRRGACQECRALRERRSALRAAKKYA